MPPRQIVQSLPFRGTLAVALMALAGCAAAPATQRHSPTVATPGHWQLPVSTSSSDAVALATWWRQFNDPSLNQLIVIALGNGPDVRTALNRVKESRSKYGYERGNLLPSVSAGVSGQGSRMRNRQTDLVTRTENYSGNLDASWEIDLFGREALSISAAHADLAQTEENLRNAQATLAAEVASTYVDLRSSLAQIAVVERSVTTRTQTLQIAEWREQAGLASTLDTQQSLSALEQARASLPSLRQTAQQARNKLALLCGKTPGALDGILGTTSTVPHAAAELAIGVPADTLRQRPDVRSAEQALEAAAARTRAAQRKRLPSLSLTGSIGVEAFTAGKLLSPQETTSNILGSLTAPIFNAGQIRAQIGIQTAQEEEAFVAYESAVLTALSEVENALFATRSNQERIAVLERADQAARTSAKLAEQEYESGQIDLLSVLDAQRTLLSIEQQRVTSDADLASAYIQLYKAVGGGWSKI